MDNHRRHLDRGFNWLGGATVTARVVDFATILVVLLYLSKDDVGLASLVVSIGTMIEALDGLGTGDALVQAPQVSTRQRDTIFWFNLGFAILVGALTLLAAPWIGALYGTPGMAALFLAVAIKQPLVAASVVPLAMLSRALAYERIALVNVAASLGAALVRLVLAVNGFGVWSLVAGYVAIGLFILVGAFIAWPVRPRLTFDFASARPLLRFGLGSATANLFEQTFKNIDYLLIGWFYGAAPLAVYRVAFDTAMEPATAVGTLVGRTALPVFARVASVRANLADTMSWSLSRVIGLVAPLMMGLALAADPLMSLLHDGEGHSYIASALPLKILAAAALLRVIAQLLPPVLMGSGRPGTAARLSAATLLLLGGGILAVGLNFPPGPGIVAMAAVWLAVYPLLLGWGVFYLKKRWDLNPMRLAAASAVPLAGLAVVTGLALAARAALGGDARTGLAIAVLATLIAYSGEYLWRRRTLQAEA